MGIDSNTLLSDIENLAYTGIVLSVEQRALLQTSLTLCKDQYKFRRIYLWGKILGIKEDYFIAVGVGVNELNARAFLYSHDCLRWKFLNPPIDEHFQMLNNCKGRFTGDPSHQFECKTYKIVGEEDEEHIEEEIVSVFFSLCLFLFRS
jgi:radial spoke head protein 9